MLELASQRKNKISLSDYNAQQDIESRIFLSECSAFEIEVLEAILFSPLKILIQKLALSLNASEEDLEPILKKLTRIGLIQVQDETLLVDKERRKSFEFQITRFEEGFKPNIDFLHGMLKQVPIPILPLWYSIPRSSNSIFDSIVEKYLFSPQIYERYLEEVLSSEPTYSKIWEDLLSSEDLKISSNFLIDKYHLTRLEFEEIMLHLEFRFIAFTTYQRNGNQWQEWVVPFYEWSQLRLFMKNTEAPLIQQQPILSLKPEEFAFVKDMGIALQLMKGGVSLSDPALALHFSLPENDPSTQSYITQVFEKLALIKLAECRKGLFFSLDGAKDWLALSLENRAVALYRHPFNRLERNAKEAEKIIKRALHGEWVFFDDVFRGTMISFCDDSKKPYKPWKIPTYTEDEKNLIKTALFGPLFECGMVSIGTCRGRDCFVVTSFGKTFFED